ncbi:hypothetical protein [Carboxydocella sp. ULO1]|uniref:AMP-binding enzyme n=1 Tax=Carboxydocella sp. ULO1 TaxID=1926599 RepID=UPI001FA937A0|nr:hypothetical protein [Carboxydocella sp. ULO1]
MRVPNGVLYDPFPAALKKADKRFQYNRELVTLTDQLNADPQIDLVIEAVPEDLALKKPGQQLKREEVLQFCRQRLAEYKVPRKLEFVEALPRNANGKVLKKVLKEM